MRTFFSLAIVAALTAFATTPSVAQRHFSPRMDQVTSNNGLLLVQDTKSKKKKGGGKQGGSGGGSGPAASGGY